MYRTLDWRQDTERGQTLFLSLAEWRSSVPSMQIRTSEVWEAYLSGPGMTRPTGPRTEAHPTLGGVSPPPNHPPVLAPHSLAEVACAAGCEGQGADEGVTGIKGGPQQHLTPVIYTLGQGPRVGAGGQQGHPQPSDWTSSPWNSNMGRREGKRRVERRGKGPRAPATLSICSQ